jgi:hypothetical protein
MVDQENQSDELMIKAHLAFTDEVPLIIGFKDLMDKVKLYMDYIEKIAYLEIL